MSKSIKLKNNTYIDSSGVTHNRTLLSTILSDFTTKINNLLGRVYIQESGSNSDGNYIKYSNGIMICYGAKTFTKDVTSAWGSIYETATAFSLGNFPKAFIEKPSCIINCLAGTTVWVESQNTTETVIGNTWVMRPVSTPNCNFTLSYIAIGKWK